MEGQQLPGRATPSSLKFRLLDYPPPPLHLTLLSPSPSSSTLSLLLPFQVMKAKLGIVALLAERAGIFGKRSTSCAMPALVEKLADVKVR